MEPILKWAGGKRQLLPEIVSLIDLDDSATFYEPFVGGGSVFMALAHPNTVINDSNIELINVYQQIKDSPTALIALLKEHKRNHSHDYYYSVRNLQRLSTFNKLTNIERAARTIYLNRTCYNGLYRVNANGFFNVPIGGYKNPDIVQENKIMELSQYLNTAKVRILCGDFEKAVLDVKEGDVVYFDPPYDYEREGFIKYTAAQFKRDDLQRLKELCDNLAKKKCHIIISNNNTEYVRVLFEDTNYEKKIVTAKRYINCNGNKRSSIEELIIIR